MCCLGYFFAINHLCIFGIRFQIYNLILIFKPLILVFSESNSRFTKYCKNGIGGIDLEYLRFIAYIRIGYNGVVLHFFGSVEKLILEN